MPRLFSLYRDRLDQANTMNLQALANTPFSVGTALFLGRIFPSPLGHWLADRIATTLASRPGSGLVQTIRHNQQGIFGGHLSPAELDQAVAAVLRNDLRSIYDYYHLANQPEKLLKRVTFSSAALAAMQRTQQNLPTVFACAHLGNFDLMGRALALNHYPFLVLSYPNPNQGYKMQNWLRKRFGLEVSPMSLESLRVGKKRLKSGGSVLTGLDRPLASPGLQKYQPRFFGKPANLPVAYIRLAMDTGAPVIVIACTVQPDGAYHLHASDPIQMNSSGDLHADIIHNAEAVLSFAEGLVRQYHDQWLMFFPVWEGDEE